jgi:hypothetical protein
LNDLNVLNEIKYPRLEIAYWLASGAGGKTGSGTWFFTGGKLRRYAHIAFKSASVRSFILNQGMGGKISRPLGCP